jgi:hypothetical protein
MHNEKVMFFSAVTEVPLSGIMICMNIEHEGKKPITISYCDKKLATIDVVSQYTCSTKV